MNRLNKHRWIAALLSLVCTGLGMFYIGTPLMILGAVILLLLQGLCIIVFFYTLGFFGLLILPVMLGFHLAGVLTTVLYFNRRSSNPFQAESKGRRFDSGGRLVFRTGLGLAAAFCAFYFSYTTGMDPFSKTSGEKQAVKEEAEAYLEQKYNEPFDVKEVDFLWTSGSYRLQVQSGQHPELEFRMRATDDVPPKFSDDDYLEELWSRQLNEKLQPVMNELYDGKAYADFDLNAKSDTEVIRRYEDVLEKENILADQHVNLIVFADLDAEFMEAEKERTLELIRRLESNMADSLITLDISYYPSSLFTDSGGTLAAEDFESVRERLKSSDKTYELRVKNIKSVYMPNNLNIKEVAPRE